MSSFTCPRCQSTDVGVKDSRSHPAGIRRRRQCAKCDFRFTTIERAVNLSTRETMALKRDEAVALIGILWADEYDDYKSGTRSIAEIAAAHQCSAGNVTRNFDIVRSRRAQQQMAAE